jgi:perosamine synthetase
MSNLHAALGCSQLEQITSFIIKKREIAKNYAKKLRADFIRVLGQHPGAYNNYWVSVIFLNDSATMGSLYSFLRDQGIGASLIWQPLDTLPMFTDCYSFSEVAHDIYSRALLLPSYVELSEEDQDMICDTINNFFGV